MSIFRNTFTKEVQEQLKVRQNALNNRNPQAIQQINARNAWVRMTSGVDVSTKPKLAEQYILQGGVLLDKKLRSGISTSTGAYNIKTPGGSDYKRGIRPMPGITSVDIKSVSAYGSLREVTVNFICHDISQLEDLELLYMRPGYTVLVEWGWLPYLDNNGNIQNVINFYDDVLTGGKDFPTILSDLFKRSKQHHGNYDATYGYVKNYNWTARMDGGYDCQTTIISIGEILESLKVNVTSFDAIKISKEGGLLFGQGNYNVIRNGLSFSTNFTLPFLPENYAENNLVGLLYELITFVESRKKEFPSNKLIATVFTDKKGITYDMIGLDYKSTNPSTNTTTPPPSVKSYITLESFIKLLNSYVILGVKKTNEDTTSIAIAEVSSKPNQYDSDNLSGEEKESLLCLAHPLQVSTDLDVCLITSPVYANGVTVNVPEMTAGQENGASSRFDTAAKELLTKIKEAKGVFSSEDTAASFLIEKIAFKDQQYTVETAKEFARAFYNTVKGTPNDAFSYIKNLKDNIDTDILTDEELKKFNEGTSDILFSLSTYEKFAPAQAATNKAAGDIAAQPSNTVSLGPIDYLSLMEKSPAIKKFQYGDGNEELGKIGNIYLNMANLQELARNTDGTSSEKKEIKLYDYLKRVLSQVQESIGNVNNFEIHTDPIDNKPRIIDVNYTETKSAKQNIFDNAFKIEIANTSGSVRSYNLQSQIFPEQSAMISISAQIGNGGEQGYQNNTLLDFNRGITDRIITKKIDQASSINSVSDDTKLQNLAESLNFLKEYILPKTETQVDKTPDVDASNPAKYKAALRDIISYVQSITDSQSKNRSIIPVKISITMDGIGGLVIGHLFQFPSELLPEGYKFNKTTEIGAKLLQTVMRLGHKIENNDWTTTIEAYNIVFNNPSGTLTFNDLFKKGVLSIPLPESSLQTNFAATNNEAKKSAEIYLGRQMSDDEWTQLVTATFAEASGNQTERGYVMGVILNRVRTNFGRYGGTVTAQLNARNQFQSVTGTKNNPGPSPNYKQGPNKAAADSIYGAAVNVLPKVPKTYLSFTAASAAAYGPGTNPNFRQTLLDKGGIIIGQTIFA